MGVPARQYQPKSKPEQEDKKPVHGASDIVNLAEGDVTAVASPARMLQARLQAHFTPMRQVFYARYVSVFMAIAFVGSVLAMSGGQTTL